jgi:hypothetical protein
MQDLFLVKLLQAFPSLYASIKRKHEEDAQPPRAPDNKNIR